jgi:hypothetical protein
MRKSRDACAGAGQAIISLTMPWYLCRYSDGMPPHQSTVQSRSDSPGGSHIEYHGIALVIGVNCL